MSLSTSETERGGRWLFAILALVLAVSHSGAALDDLGASFVVIVPAAAAAAAIAKGRHLFTILAFMVGLLSFVLLVPIGDSRAIFAGLLVATTVAAAALSHVRAGRLSVPIAVVLSLIASSVLRLVPLDSISVGSVGGLVIAACAIVVLSSDGEVRVPAVAFGILLALVIPHEPSRGLLFACAVLLTIVLLRFWSLPLLGIATAASAIANPWALALPAAVIAGRTFARERSTEAAMLVVPTLAVSRFFIPLLVFASEFPRRLSSGAIAAVTLILAGLFAPSGVAQLLVAGAIGMLLLERRDDETAGGALITSAWSLFILANFHRSGALASLIVPVRSIALTAVILLVGVLVVLVANRSNRLAAMILSVALLLFVYRGSMVGSLEREGDAGSWIDERGLSKWFREGPNLESVDRSLAAGVSTDVELSRDARSLEVVLSAANLPQLPASSEIGSISWLDGKGGGHRVPITAGQLADWGAYRRAFRWRTRNALPSGADERVEGFGSESFVVGSGVIRIQETKSIRRIKVAAAESMPAGNRLHFVGFRISE